MQKIQPMSPVAKWTRNRRMDRCRADLASPSLHGSSISNIAWSWGFKDAAHFSHAFKARFGTAPGEFRRSALGEGVATPVQS